MTEKLMQTILRHFGSQRALARHLGVTDGSVSQWVKQLYFPATQAIRIEKATGIKASEMIKQD